MEVNGQKEPAEGDLYITFLKDGTFINSEEGNKSATGKWVYNHKAMTLTTEDVLKKILKINEKELNLSSTMDGETMIVALKRVD